VLPKRSQNKGSGWGFGSVEGRLPSKHKALGSVSSSENRKEKKKKNKGSAEWEELWVTVELQCFV